MRIDKFAADVHAKLNDPTVVYVRGRNGLQAHDVLRRAVWIVDGGSVGEATPGRAGRKDTSSTTGTVAPYDRRDNVQIHLFADTDDNLETLFENMIVALNRTNSRCRPTYRFTTEEPGGAGRALRAEKCVLTFPLAMPMIEEISMLTPIASHALAAEITS